MDIWLYLKGWYQLVCTIWCQSQKNLKVDLNLFMDFIWILCSNKYTKNVGGLDCIMPWID